ncbi:hypothetical protein DTW90_37380 [Neorhizobium sp. P12A]|jgi:hypothetical protein|nr:hypothetical protein DTW90_37380 [Neorhizobium sp. P12A]
MRGFFLQIHDSRNPVRRDAASIQDKISLVHYRLGAFYPHGNQMRIQIHIIAVLLSMMSWVISFDAARAVYRHAHEAGMMPYARAT